MESLVVVVSLTLTLVFIWILLSRPDLEKVTCINLSAGCREMARDPSRRAEAVELCHQETGASRSDATLAVELFVAGESSEAVWRLASQKGKKIPAIKLLREETGVSLLAAKISVEKYLANQGSTTS